MSALIPNMTSNTTPSGVASASSIYDSSYDAFDAMTGSPSFSTFWNDGNGVSLPQWLRYDFDSPVTAASFSIMAWDSGGPLVFEIQGSNDGFSTYTTLGSFDLTMSSPWGVYNTPPIASYSNNLTASSYAGYRLYVTSGTGGGNLSITEFQLYDVPVPGMTGYFGRIKLGM